MPLAPPYFVLVAACSASKSLRGLVLSSSVDWTTRLWRLGNGSNSPLQSLTHGTYDYVCDAKWYVHTYFTKSFLDC